MGRRRLVVAVACLVALATIGIGVAIAAESDVPDQQGVGERLLVVDGIDAETEAGLAGPDLVQVFHAEWGAGEGEVGLSEDRSRSASSFALDSDGLVYVLDGVNHRVLLVSGDGRVVGELQMGSVLEPYDLAIGDDGTVIAYDPGTASFQAYGVDGRLIGTQGYPDDFYPGFLFAKAGTVYVSAGWDGPSEGYGYVPLFRDGSFLTLENSKSQALSDIPVLGGTVKLETTGSGDKHVCLMDGDTVLADVQLLPRPSGPIYPGILEDGRLVVAAVVPEDSDSYETVLKRVAWVTEPGSGSTTLVDFGPEDRRVGYVHVEARVAVDGSIFFLSSDSTGLTLSRAKLQ